VQNLGSGREAREADKKEQAEVTEQVTSKLLHTMSSRLLIKLWVSRRSRRKRRRTEREGHQKSASWQSFGLVDEKEEEAKEKAEVNG
jgi:hypothetical protein